MADDQQGAARRRPIRSLRLDARHAVNDREPLVLIFDHPADRLTALPERLESLGFQLRMAKSRSDLQSLLDEHSGRGLVAVFPQDVDTCDLDWLVAALPERANGAAPMLVAAGPRPEIETCAQLRSRGVEHGLWEPHDDNRLRFVLNEVMGRHGRATQRSEPRVPTTLRARVGRGERAKRVTVYNLSVHGAYFETPRPTMSGVTVAIEIELPDGPLRTEASVAHTNVPGNLNFRSVPVGMGVRFTGRDEADASRLRRFVAQQAADLEV